MLQSQTELTIHSKVKKGSIFLSLQLQGQPKRESCLAIPKSTSYLLILNSIVVDDLLLKKETTRAHIALLDRIPKIFLKKSEALVERTEVLDFTDQLQFVYNEPSHNLFRPLGRSSIDGKDYRGVKEGQQKIFNDISNLLPDDGQQVRKAYSETKTTRSVVVKRQSIWDLLYPILLPPVTLDFTEQFDLFKPLREYQQTGIQFLIDNTSALLADEMGTGKTVQTVVALRILFRQGKIKNAIVVCPPAILGSAHLSVKTGKSEGWDGHFFNWAPELSVTVVRGNAERRKVDWKYPAHIYLVTYDILRNDLETGVIEDNEVSKFECAVIDEAQNIKNQNSGRAKAVRKLSPKFRWALTGTPIETKVEDVISIFSFVKPRLFTRENYSADTVKELIEPYFLRRLKKDVLKDLPSKIRQEEWLELDSDQRAAYDHALATGRSQLAGDIGSKNEITIRSHVFALLQELKQICNFGPGKNKSPKTESLLDLIETIKANGKKVLVFTQYIENGIDKLETLLQAHSIKYVTLKGGMSDVERNRVFEQFRNSNLEISVFLGSVRAAGTGITLTEASYVVHFDHWWNPAVMWQAEDRAHRPPQKENLNVYSFWMVDTIEEGIYEKLRQRGLLIESVIDSLAVDAIEELISTDEWLEILGVKKIESEKQDSVSSKIENTLQRLKVLTPIEFENITRDFFVRQGYVNARVTKRSYDGGIDVFGSRLKEGIEESFIAQCKRTDSVGVKVAREIFGVLAAHEKVSSGYVITSGTFTEECLRFASANPKLILIDGYAFANLLIQFKIF